MRETVNVAVKGWLKVYGILPNGERIVLLDRPNTIVNNARTIVAKALGNTTWAGLNKVKAWKAAVLLSDNNSMVITYPGTYEVQFNARFSTGSFNDTLDELSLESSTLGRFSEVTGLSVFKDNTMQMEVEWKLTINTI